MSARRIGFYPGSFDPFTYGHLNIAKRAAALVDELHISVGLNPAKSSGLFNAAERIEIIKKTLEIAGDARLLDPQNIIIDSYSGFLVDHAKAIGAKWIFRGLRPVTDFADEFLLQGVNRSIAPDVDTVVLFAESEHEFKSSTVLKQIAMTDHSSEAYAPDFVRQAIRKKAGK